MVEPESILKVFMMPWLAHGHISPFLELAKKLTKRNIFVYLCSTPINLQSSATKKLTPPYSESIKLVELHLPTLPNLPPHYHTTNGLPLNLLDTLREAFQMSKPELSNILLDLKPDFFIHDYLVRWAGEVASSVGIPAIDFVTTGASAGSYFMNMVYHPGSEFPFPEIYLHEYEKAMIVRRPKARSSIDRSDEVNPEMRSFCNVSIIKSIREIEGKYIDYLVETTKKAIFPIGLLVNKETLRDDDSLDIIQWLNKKEKGSSIFVSFGTECFLLTEEVEEIAHGLELSDVNFIWVIRLSKETEEIKVEDILPKGFIERVGERGKIVEGWAPQATILRHESIGGFVSHCGWNSILESMTFGVPIIANPMQYDQPLNAKLVVAVGVGLEVAREEKTGRMERKSLAKVVRELVVEKGGERVRRRAREISDVLRSKGEEEIDEFTKQLVQFNEKRKKTI